MKRVFGSALFVIASLIFFISAKPKDHQRYKEFNLKQFEKSLAYIPAGTFHFGTSDFNFPSDIDIGLPDSNTNRMITLQSFYMSKYEISNGQYLEFVNDLMKNGRQQEYQKALPDTTVWREKMAYNEPYVDYYFRHPAYSTYPVVGITHEQAEMFCQWLAQKYMQIPGRKYQKVLFRLPKRYEWEYAARGGRELSNFPWAGNYLKNQKGEFMANFLNIDQPSVYRDKDGKLKVKGYGHVSSMYGVMADVTAPVQSYSPNGYGLYNMAGNVEEFVKEKGLTRGGSWCDPGFYLMVWVEEKYDTLNSPSSARGFRFVMEVLQ